MPSITVRGVIYTGGHTCKSGVGAAPAILLSPISKPRLRFFCV
jgi:hypothetical protein